MDNVGNDFCMTSTFLLRIYIHNLLFFKGKVTLHEYITQGFEHFPEAFTTRVKSGDDIGKILANV